MIGRTIGQYQVIDKIGEGGMGAVYKAEDTTLHRLVALKTLSGHLTEDEEAQKRFIREAQSASSLNHPNITTVHEFIEDDDTRLICMEYVEGKTIRDMVESGIVSVRKAIDIITQAAEALEAAHNKGILHRDIKSANIMVNMEGRVKVMDFGLAHLESRSQLTRTGTTMGTLSYSSPEQISGRSVDRRSEIFSLGVVFYELLTGQLPFKATNEAEILFAIINNEPPKLTTVREDVPELVEAVVSKMLEKDPELRYQNCGDVINDLRGIRKEMETSTIGITGVLRQTERARKSKRGLWIGLGSAAAVLIAVGLMYLPVGPELDREMAVVSVFENISGDPSLDRLGTLPVLVISQGLQNSGLLTPYPEQTTLQLNNQIIAALEGTGGTGNASQMLAKGSGAGYVITGQYWKQGDDLFIQSNIIDFTNSRRGTRIGGTDPLKGSSDNLDAILPVLLEQTLIILQRHLHPFSDWVELTSPTTSLKAMNLYMEAFDAFTRDYREVIDLSTQARQEDPSYMAPLLLMITSAHNLGLRGNRDWLYWFSMCDSLIQLAEADQETFSQWDRSWVKDLKGWLLGDREASYRASLEALGSTSIAAYEAGLNTKIINRPEEAVRYLEQIDFEIPWAREWLGNWTVYADALCMLGRYRKAERIIRHGLEVNPESRSLLRWEARILAAKGNLKALDRLVERCLEIAPSTTWLPTHVLLSAAQVLHGFGPPEKAQELLATALNWMTDHPDEIERDKGHYALLLLTAGRLEEARTVYTELLKENPDDRPDKVAWLGRYGDLLAMLGDRDAALEVSRQIASVDGQQYRKGRHTYWRASIAANLGDLDEAMRLLLQAESEGNTFDWYLSYAFELAPLRDHPPFMNWIKPKG